METRTYTVYKFGELSKEGKEKAIQNYYDINVDHEWWSFIYDDIKNIGAKITDFDLGRSNYCAIEPIQEWYQIACNIRDNHGESCDTHKEAIAFIKNYEETIENAEKDENGDFVAGYVLDKILNSLEREFKYNIQECYRIMLQKEYEYLTSEEAIKETLISNEYDFTIDGKID